MMMGLFDVGLRGLLTHQVQARHLLEKIAMNLVLLYFASLALRCSPLSYLPTNRFKISNKGRETFHVPFIIV